VQPTTYSFDEHQLNQNLIDKDALFVIHSLRGVGHSAYLVGGCVRDLLTGTTPKDFDISTSARPEQIKRLFGRRCILIGRRFRLAHLRFGKKVLEVSTFRAGEMTEDLIVQDNVWGTEQEDVLRRDFTINGLYYDPETQTVIDYVGGWKDLQKRVLHTIGDPKVRFQQDPVRMIRLLKFQARLGFKASSDVQAGLKDCLPEITKSSPARVLEELFRMMESCASAKFFKMMLDSGLCHRLSPRFAEQLGGPFGPAIFSYLSAADRINKNASRFPIERAVLAASILYPVLEAELQTQFIQQGNIPNQGEIFTAAHTLTRDIMIASFTHFPRRISSAIAYILVTQFRFTPFKNKRQNHIRLFRIREFPQALRLLKIRATVDQEFQNVYIEWRENFRNFLRQEEHQPHQHRHKSQRHSYADLESKNR
jgi:poly(A) polymerase